jgi:uncharacterized protein (TIGR02145 family)
MSNIIMARPLRIIGTKISGINMNRDLILRFIAIVFTVSIVILAPSCKKSDSAGSTTKAPLAITNTASWVGNKWATLQGQVNGKKLFTTVSFQYDTTTSLANSVSPSPDTTSSDQGISFSYTLTNLKPKTRYYYRISAVSEGGIGNGSNLAFTTTDTNIVIINFNPNLLYDSIYDIEGKKYKTIVIGTQIWMAENLRSAKLNDGTDIPYTSDIYKWASLTTPGYSWYNGDSVGYGAVYNWYTVGTGKLCPQGWHVPSDEEWTVLTDYLGGSSVAGGLLKEVGSVHWIKPNAGATNESGFTALPSGYRGANGGYSNLGHYGVWWTSTEWSSGGAWYRDLYNGYESVDRSNTSKKGGGSVRCVKN